MHVDISSYDAVSPPCKRGLSKVTSSRPAQWHVVYTHSYSENLAASHLLNQGFHTFLPKRRKIVRHARKTSEVREAFFPRYLFVAFASQHTQWRCINGTRGVSHLLCVRNQPLTLPRGLVESLIAATDSEGIMQSREKLEAGQKVRIVSGHLKDHVGRLAEETSSEEVKIFIEMMAREVPVYTQRDFVISIL